MSNLWFFRLKRAEQQRRRSSGEQSAGSASVQSAAGLSASSAPPAVCGPGSGPAAMAPHSRSHQRQHQHQHCHHHNYNYSHHHLQNQPPGRLPLAGCGSFGGAPAVWSGSAATSGLGRRQYRHSYDCASFGPRCDQCDPEPLEQQRHQESPPNEHFSAQTADQRASSLEGGSRRQPLVHQRPSINYEGVNMQRHPQEPRPPQPPQDQPAAYRIQTVPQVNIIRTDSCSSSNFDQDDPLAPVAAIGSAPVPGPGPAPTPVPVPLLVELTRGDARSRPESRCIRARDESAAVEIDIERARNGDEPQESAQKFSSKRGLLHDQLRSGKVPPIHEHHLLNPQGQQGAALGQMLGMADSMDNLAALIPRVRVEFYNSENTLKEQLQLYFIKDHTVSLYVRSAKLILKVLACYLYVFRVIYDRGPGQANCYGCQLTRGSANATSIASDAFSSASSSPGGSASQLLTQAPLSKFDSHPYDGPINFRALFWVDRGPTIWLIQATIAVICFIEAILMQYLTYKNSIFSIISFHFTLELVTNVPFILSIFWTELRTLFVPGFLNCWLAKQCLEAMLNDLSIVRQSSVFSHRLTILSATVFCLIFTSACGFQHTQRSGGRDRISVFESIYFVVVTFSTVGYGDLKPETWPSQLFIMVMICVALIVLPTQFEQLAYFWIERKKLGASYAHHSNRHEKHVVVCSTTLRADTIMDFLNEFYAHPLLQTFSVVLLSPCEMDPSMKLKLQTPTWNNRVVYIQGSALKANDLIRARMQSAEACFILAARNYNDRSAADEHTILRSWAIRDFSPYVPQYVQIFRTENKIHVAFAEHVVCDDEFKYALLANNCLIPGTSTLVTLLLHTSQHKRLKRHGNLFNLKWLRKRARLAHGGATAGDFAQATALLQQQQHLLQQQQQQPSPQQQPTGGQTNNEAADCCSDSDDENEPNSPEWKRLYGKCSANEIYHIRLSDSRFFGEYQGKSFTYASFHSHRKFGVALIGVQTDMRGTWPIMLNPGPSYVLKSSDILFYINITKEENSTLRPMIHQRMSKGGGGGSGGGGSCMGPNQSALNLIASSSLFTPTPIESGTDPPTSTSVGAAGGAPATYIRIEASSPTIGLQQQQQVVADPALSGQQQQQAECGLMGATEAELQQVMAAGYAGLTPKKHSVADGASIVARSLCSVAGFPASEFPVALPVSRADSDEQQQAHKPLELQHLTTKMLAKRNSSASASGAIGGSGQEHQQHRQSGLGSRNASTLELAAIATGLRKGSNMSITSTKSRDASPTRLKQVVSGLAVKMKRVKLGKSLTHLTIPRMDLGGGSSNSSTESFVNARGRRPSIAPVPAMMGESEEHDSDHEREQESYFAMSWQSNSESSPIVKKFVFCTTYVGVSPTLCYLLQRKKPPCCLQLISACEHCPFKNARQYNWSNRCIILASDFASNGIYNFLVPLRAHSHNPNELRPIVLLLERKPSPQFIDAISWFPMVYWMPGSIDSLDDLIKAGINQAHSVVVTNKESTNSAEEDYLADCNTIVAVQTMFKMFPSAGIITELSQSSNMRFMQFRAHDVLFGGLSMARSYQMPPVSSQQQAQATSGGAEVSGLHDSSSGAQQTGDSSAGSAGFGLGNAIRDRIMLRKFHSKHYSKLESSMDTDVNSHAYKYRLPFAAGNVFSASMLDTLLYQAFVKDYMITMVRLLLGIDQAPGSGFLSSMRITKEDLWIRTYGRLYQRLCSTTCEIPLGIYRTEPLESQHRYDGGSFGAFASQQASYEQATEEIERGEIVNMVKNRLQDLGMNVNDYDDSASSRNNTFSYVIINPNCDIPLREGDIIYLIRPSPIHSRKLFMHRANSVRHADETTAAANAPPCGVPFGSNQFSECKQAKQQQPQQQHHHHHHHHHHREAQHQRDGHSAVGQQYVENPGSDSAAGGEQQRFVNQATPKAASHNYNNSHGPIEIAGQEQQAAHEQLVHMKSCYSDGDFNEILIKVNNPDEESMGGNPEHANGVIYYDGAGRKIDHRPPGNLGYDCMNGVGSSEQLSELKNRRRSSCSDAEDTKPR